MFTLALDLDDLMAQSRGDPDDAVAPGTSIGHVHLKVADVPRADSFYRQALGFQEQAQLPSAAFVSAGGYHHHIGLNSWQSAGSQPPPDTAPRLRSIGFELSGAAALGALGERAGDAALAPPPAHGEGGIPQALAFEDPDGNRLEFAARSA